MKVKRPGPESHLTPNRQHDAALAADYAERCKQAVEHCAQIARVFIGATPRRFDRTVDVVMIARDQLELMLRAELDAAERTAVRAAKYAVNPNFYKETQP